ncbi:MAG: divalent metal cation transporter, partial [Lewinella sp.]
EVIMKAVIAVMFLVVIACAIMVAPGYGEVAGGLFVPTLTLNRETLLFSFALIGGVGGTLTIMCYAYWLREKRSLQAVSLRDIRLDLGFAYLLTALFGIAVTVIAAGVQPEAVGGYGLVTGIADRLAVTMGRFGYWIFLLGFWAAVLTSMIGVWSGVPYLFADLWYRYRRRYNSNQEPPQMVRQQSPYQWFLLYLALPPILLTLYQRPAWIGVAYAVSGAAFMPFLAVTLLYQNNKSAWVGRFRNGGLTNAVLGISLLLFIILLASQLDFIG